MRHLRFPLGCVGLALLIVGCSNSEAGDPASASGGGAGAAGGTLPDGGQPLPDGSHASDAQGSDASHPTPLDGSPQPDGQGPPDAPIEPDTALPPVDASTSYAAPCAQYGEPQALGQLFGGVPETSGIVASRKQPGVLWIHEDSGTTSSIYAINSSGTLLGSWQLSQHTYDWEDISIESTASGPDRIWAGDIGDNAARDPTMGDPRESIRVFRVDEPTVDPSQVLTGTAPVIDTLTFTYPDKPHDAEAMAVDPTTGDMYIFSKEGTTDGSTAPLAGIFRAAAPVASGVLTQVGTLDVTWIDAADFAPNGRELIVRNYGQALYWSLPEGSNWVDVLSSTAPTSFWLTNQEPGGEAVAFAYDASGFFTVSEQADDPDPVSVWFFPKACP